MFVVSTAKQGKIAKTFGRILLFDTFFKVTIKVTITE